MQEPSLTDIIRTANLKRKALGIKISEHKFMPQFKKKKSVTLYEGSPYTVEVCNWETTIKSFFQENQ